MAAMRPESVAATSAVVGAATVAMDQSWPSSSSAVTPSISCMALRTAVTGLTRLDDFDMEQIGQGFFANVYKVRHQVTDEIMVLKLAKSSAAQAQYRSDSSSLREVQVMKSLSHPKILRFYGVCVHGGQLHPLVEYINGGVLEELLLDRSKEITWQLRFKLSLDIAEGMAYLHSMGMFHRDLTSKNVLLRVQGDQMEAVVADFGLAAKIPLVIGKALNVVGTPYWMAPEVLNGEPYNEKADVFSYGIILCEILTRVGADPDNLPRKHNYGLSTTEFTAMVEEDAPPVLVRLAIHCCQLAPERRLTFSLVMLTLNRHRGKNLHTDRFSQRLVLQESTGSSDCESSLAVEDTATFGRSSPSCSPQPQFHLDSPSSASAAVLQCLSPPLSCNAYRLPSPNDDIVAASFSSPELLDRHQEHHERSASRSSRDVLDEYCCAKSVCIPSPDSLSSHSTDMNGAVDTCSSVFSFEACSSHQAAFAGGGEHLETPALHLSPPPSASQPMPLACVSPSHDVRGRAWSGGGGKSPRSSAARPARHQRSASLSKHLVRLHQSVAEDQASTSAPNSPTSPRRAGSLFRHFRIPAAPMSP